MLMQMLGGFADLERAMIRERTRSGLAAARAKGRAGGAATETQPRSAPRGHRHGRVRIQVSGRCRTALQGSSDNDFSCSCSSFCWSVSGPDVAVRKKAGLQQTSASGGNAVVPGHGRHTCFAKQKFVAGWFDMVPADDIKRIGITSNLPCGFEVTDAGPYLVDSPPLAAERRTKSSSTLATNIFLRASCAIAVDAKRPSR